MHRPHITSWRSLWQHRLQSWLTRHNTRRRSGARHTVLPSVAESLETRTLLSTGSLDPTFGEGGKVLTNIGVPGTGDRGHDVIAYQSDGKSIIVGSSEGDMIAVRYNTDGTRDSTFGTNGVVWIDFGGSDQGWSVAVDSADRVLVAGESYQGGSTGNDFAVARLTAAGDLDTSFSTDGKQTIDFGSSNERAYSVAVDSVDRVLVGGFSVQGGSTGFDFAVARLTAAGELDTSFGIVGKQTIDFGNSPDNAYSLAVDSANRVLVGGRSNQYQGGSTGWDFAVARLTAAGTLDNSFDGDGKQTIDFGDSYDEGHSVAVDSTDRVLVGGYSDQGGLTGFDVAVARLTSAGDLDTSFDNDGKQTIDFGSTDDFGFSVAVDSTGRVLVGGFSAQGGLTGLDFAVARLTAAGILDASFDSDGKQTIDFGNSSDNGQSVAVDSGDRVLVGGFSIQGGFTGDDFALARLTAAGDLDASFDSDGKLTLDIGATIGTGDTGRDVIAYQSDGKSIMVGSSEGDMIAVRYNTDGTRDSTFGTNGVVRIDFGGFDYGEGVAVDSAGRVLVAGVSGGDFAVARLTAAGTLDTSFDGDGKQTIDFGNSIDGAYSVAVDSFDRVLVAGPSYQGVSTGYDFAVARLTDSGALDASFGSDGKQTIVFGNSEDWPESVAVDSFDRVLVGGYSEQGGSTGYDFAVSRLTAAGDLDASFDSDGKRTIDFGSFEDIGYSVAVDSADRVLVGGYSDQGGLTGYDFAVARLTAAGDLDATFHSDGMQTIDFGNSYDEGCSVAVDSADRVLVGGSSDQGGATLRDFAVARLTAAGNLDASFDSDGKQTIDFGNSDDVADSVAVDSGDRVLVSGSSYQSGWTGKDFALARLSNDDDTDGVSDHEEGLAPNGGDGNNDGIADSDQDYVASLPDSDDGSFITVASELGSPLSQVSAINNPSPDDVPAGVDFPVGHLDFSVQLAGAGAATTVTLIPENSESFNTYYKFGPEPGNTTPHWYEFIYDGTTGAEFLGGTVVLHFVDGLRGDDDLTANGVIVDPGAPGINNFAPTINSVTVPLDPVNINDQSSFSVDVSFTDPAGANDEDYSCEFDMDGDLVNDVTVTGVTGGSCSVPLSYDEPGVYSVTVIVTDQDGDFSVAVTATEFIVVYDASGGFVTGGGWIDSPAGALVADPTVTGKANFGFVSKYQKGANVPTGNTEFNFKAGDLNFHSDTYEWLVVNQNNTNAQYKGSGTINGDAAPTGDLFKFMIWAKDDPDGTDTFRIKIWYEDGGSEVLVYDNGFDQPIGGGNIKIHAANGSSGAFGVATSSAALPQSQPDKLTLVSGQTNDSASLAGQMVFVEAVTGIGPSLDDDDTHSEPTQDEAASTDSLEDLLPLSVTAGLLT